MRQPSWMLTFLLATSVAHVLHYCKCAALLL